MISPLLLLKIAARFFAIVAGISIGYLLGTVIGMSTSRIALEQLFIIFAISFILSLVLFDQELKIEAYYEGRKNHDI